MRPLHEVILTLKTYNPVIPAEAGIHFNKPLRWIPAFAGMTDYDVFVKNLAIFRIVQSSQCILIGCTANKTFATKS